MTPVYRFIRRKFYFLSSLFARSTSLLAEFSVRRVSSTFLCDGILELQLKAFSPYPRGDPALLGPGSFPPTRQFPLLVPPAADCLRSSSP